MEKLYYELKPYALLYLAYWSTTHHPYTYIIKVSAFALVILASAIIYMRLDYRGFVSSSQK